MARHFLFLISILIIIVACNAPVQDKSQDKSLTPPGEKKAPVQKERVAEEVNELLSNQNRVKSIYYKYKGPQTGDNFYDFYIKGSKLKYEPALEIKTLDREDSYDTIFIDKEAKTAASYCEAAYCAYKGKKADLNYDDAYISTVFDWSNGLTSAKKIGEEIIDDRSTWKIDSDKGILWIDTFYGIPLKVDSSGKVYRFQQISVNSVQDADVAPS